METKLDEQFNQINELAIQVDKATTKAKEAGILN